MLWEQAHFDRAEPLPAAYSRSWRLPRPGRRRAAHQDGEPDLHAGLIQSLSEGVAFAQQVGLDVEAVVDVISKGAAGSWQMENRASTMAERRFDFGFAAEC
ncbi:MAG: NAD-binding protein [Ilumatobacteraceae bacterium]